VGVLGRKALGGAVLLLCLSSAQGAEFFVTPNAGPGGVGSIRRPWTLDEALSSSPNVKPGDTIWLRGGTYSGIFNSYLNGTAAAPIIVRQYPGERAILDGGTANTAAVLTVWGSYTWFWGFELTSSSSDRTSTSLGPSPSDLDRPHTAIQNAQQPGSGVGIKIINMVIHNCGQGIGLWKDATDAEIYGNLISYNGWNAPGRTWGHGIYSQNVAPSRRTIRDNILYANYNYNLQIYGENAHLDNHMIEGNIAFWDGAAASQRGSGASMNMGGALSASGNSLTNNAFYGSPGGGALDFSRGNQNVTMTGNVSGFPLTAVDSDKGGAVNFGSNSGSVNISGNKFYTSRIAPRRYASWYPDNTYIVWPNNPAGTWTLVRPNAYEPGRGHVAVFNWSHSSYVSVDLSSVLSAGAGYEIRNAQDYFGKPVLSGTYAGGLVSIPMLASSVETPAGDAAPNPTGPEFNAFVIVTTRSAVVAPPNSPPPLRKALKAR
jgi:hypothetical protein